MVKTFVAAQNIAFCIHKIAGTGGAAAAVQPCGIIIVGDEADLHGIRTVGGGKLALFRLLPDGLLVHIAQRKQDAFQHGAGQSGQHIGLIVGRPGPEQDGPAVAAGADAGVVARCHIAGADGIGVTQQGGKFYGRVALSAGNGSTTCQIILVKSGADVTFQFRGHIFHGKGKIQLCGGFPRGLFPAKSNIQIEGVDFVVLFQQTERSH